MAPLTHCVFLKHGHYGTYILSHTSFSPLQQLPSLIASTIMSSTGRPLQREFSRLVSHPFTLSAPTSSQSHCFVQSSISPEIDAILAKMYEDIEDPEYDGDPAETLEQVNKMIDDYYSENNYYWGLAEVPYPEEFSSSMTLQYLLVGKFNRLASSVFSDPTHRTEPLHSSSRRTTRASLHFQRRSKVTPQNTAPRAW